jgi:hypothetical protein
MIEGKMVFRDEKGYPKAVWDTNAKKWLRPEETDIPWTREKWEKVLSQYTWVRNDGVKLDGSFFFKDFPGYWKTLSSKNEIEKLPTNSEFLIFNPSGEITFWSSQEDAAKRFDEGATVQIYYKGISRATAIILSNAAFQQWQMGNKNIFLTFGDVGVHVKDIVGTYSDTIILRIEDIPHISDELGHVVSPVMRLPEHGTPLSSAYKNITISNLDPVFWLDNFIKAGATSVQIIYVLQ